MMVLTVRFRTCPMPWYKPLLQRSRDPGAYVCECVSVFTGIFPRVLWFRAHALRSSRGEQDAY